MRRVECSVLIVDDDSDTREALADALTDAGFHVEQASSGKQALVYVCNALDSSPLGTSKVRLWERRYANNEWHARTQTKDADTNGIAVGEMLR